MLYDYHDAVLMIFCKAPIPGQAKTRLMPYLSAVEAAELHCELSESALQMATQNGLCQVQLWCSPTTVHPFFTAAALAYPITLHQQQGDGLGERMSHAFNSALLGFRRALIIGCDSPSLKVCDLEQALVALEKPKTCVVAPAEDGGYVMIGLNQIANELFTAIDWGGAHVFEQTLRRIEALGFHYAGLKAQWDVDNPEDLARYWALK
jgi:rSAM/selenodomain-associated transferase 1